MPSCFVPGCKSGFTSSRKINKILGKKNPSFFFAPKDDQLLEKWQRMIRRRDRILSPKDKVCSLHFEKECINVDYETKMPNGFIHKIPRRPVLKQGSIPTIFLNSPHYLRWPTNERKSPIPCSHVSKKSIRNIESEENVESNSPQQSNDFLKMDSKASTECDIFQQSKAFLDKDREDSAEPNISHQSKYFLKLSIEAKNIPLSSRWSVACSEDFIIFAKWNTSYYPERRVVICKDLSSKIFLKKVEISLSGEESSLVNISQLLQKVEDFSICINADSEKASSCFGFIASENGILCIACSKSKKKKDVLKEDMPDNWWKN